MSCLSCLIMYSRFSRDFTHINHILLLSTYSPHSCLQNSCTHSFSSSFPTTRNRSAVSCISATPLPPSSLIASIPSNAFSLSVYSPQPTLSSVAQSFTPHHSSVTYFFAVSPSTYLTFCFLFSFRRLSTLFHFPSNFKN